MERQTGKTMKMKYAKLGKTDIEVSRICVGCMSYGKASDDFQPWTLPLEESTKMISHALDLGVNFFDTANCYSHGTSEEYLGTALKSLGVARDKVVLASKVYFNDGHLSKDAIAREIEGTLKRLGTDYLDLYQIHRFDYSTPIEETMAALDALVKSGKVRAIGASAMYGYQFHNMQIAAERNGLTLFSTLQNHYNLLYREDERDLIPVARQYGVSLIPYSPLAGGHLTHPEWESPSKRAQTDKVLRASRLTGRRFPWANRTPRTPSTSSATAISTSSRSTRCRRSASRSSRAVATTGTSTMRRRVVDRCSSSRQAKVSTRNGANRRAASRKATR